MALTEEETIVITEAFSTAIDYAFNKGVEALKAALQLDLNSVNTNTFLMASRVACRQEIANALNPFNPKEK